MLRTLSLTCAVLLFIALHSATAAPLTFTFSGSVTQVPLDEVFGDITFGDVFNGSVSFDQSATDLIPADPATGSYSFGAPFGMTVNLDGHAFDASGFLNIGILNSFEDQYTVLATSADGDLTLELFLQDDTGSAFNSDHLPTNLPSLTNFAQRDFHLDLTSSTGEVQVDGQLAGGAVTAVPEPGPVRLALTGAVVLFFLTLRKQLRTNHQRSCYRMSYLKWRRIACTLMFAVIPSSLFAVDGTMLIDQNHALAGNVTSGDAPGFPVTISRPGSYKLSGNLTVPDVNTTAIEITSPNVTLDLNGFAILGPVVCTPFTTQCPPAGKGTGILSVSDPGTPGPANVRVMNGSIHGMGLLAIQMTGAGAFVERVSVDNNAGGGMIVNGTVIDSAATANGKFGILAITVRECTANNNTTDGIVLDGSGGVGIGNIASFNGAHGMVVPNGSVTGNTIVRNGSFGITAICPSSIVGNTIVSNTLGSITQTNAEVCVLVNNANRP